MKTNGMRYDKPPITMLGAQQIISVAGDGHDDDDDDDFLPPSLLSGTISVIFTSHEGSVYRMQRPCPLGPATHGPFLA